MAQGADVVIAHRRTGTWNTAVATNTTNAGLLLNQWTMGNGLGPLLYSAALTGSGGRANAIRGLNKLNSEETAELRYTGLEHFVAMAMGIAGAPSTVDTSAHQHVFQLANNVDGLMDTIAVLKASGLPIWEYPSVKIGGFTLNLTADGLATISFPLIASKCLPLTGQTNTTLAAVTYRTQVLNVFGTHIKWRANVGSGGALADSDRFYPNSMTMTFTRNLDSEYVMDGSGVQPEPYYTDFFAVDLTFNFPVYGTGNLQANNTFLTNAFGEIPMKVDCTMTSPVIAGATTTPYSILLEFPNMVIGDVQMPVNDAGVIPQTVQMAALARATAPTGMSVTKHFQWTQVSQKTDDSLLNP